MKNQVTGLEKIWQKCMSDKELESKIYNGHLKLREPNMKMNKWQHILSKKIQRWQAFGKMLNIIYIRWLQIKTTIKTSLLEWT